MHVFIADGPSEVASFVAQIIGKTIFDKTLAVLCLPTGSTPIPTYKELVRMHKEEKLSFANVVTFNLDEYIGLDKDHKESYNYFMNHHLYQHVDAKPENVHIPDGTLPNDKYEEYCSNYEKQIVEAGGLQIALVGIGRTGHIGFNEPGSTDKDRMRVVHLHDVTIKDAAGSFGGFEGVPKTAVTMGLGTVLDAKHIILIATGKNKAEIVKKFLEDEEARKSPTDCPAVYLHEHEHVTVFLDKDAASLLEKEYTKK
ncbi:glucosamine-6-phosphate deaminase [Acrasis kona]|uniref:glucosamine-6-phosphate deaminase n=1 Tax=Acrasis kona TaxID=1008807 RepID=A0AAW2YLG6_9EUKA